MAPKREPTNTQLARLIEQQGLAHKSEITALSNIVIEVKNKVEKLDDWMVGEVRLEAYRSSHPELKNESKMNERLVQITLAVIALAGAILGVKLL